MPDKIMRILPHRLGEIYAMHQCDIEEIRLRMGQPISIVHCGTEQITVSEPVRKEELEHVLAAASENSLYTTNDTLKDGYITLPGGHRIGVCGRVVTHEGKIKTIDDISSISIRVAREKQGIGVSLETSTLIIGPPGCGKTTLLRDCIRILSDVQKARVGLVDERGEVAACVRGRPQLNVGSRTDVLTGCRKSNGVMMLLRNMNPQWIAVDEVTKEEDVLSFAEASYCGVRLLCTAHAWTQEDIYARPIYKKMMETGFFSKILVLHRDHSFQITEVM